MDAALILQDHFWQGTAPVWLGFEPSFSNIQLDLLDGCVLFQTSGSTGKAKLVALGKDALLHSAMVVNDHLQVCKKSRWALALPLHHVGGFGVVCRAYERNTPLAIFKSRWQTQEFVHWLDEEAATHTSLVPTQVHDIVTHQLHAPKSLMAVVVGGGMLSAEVGNQARQLGWPVLASYGMTEAASQIATQPLSFLANDYQPFPLPLLPHWKATIATDELLLLDGPALFRGYLEIDACGDPHFISRESPFMTQDRVALRNHSIHSITRNDCQIKILGELIDLRAIEHQLSAFACHESPSGSWAVVALPDRRAEHRLVLAYESPATPSAVKKMLDQFNSQAIGYQRIHQAIGFDRLPRSGALGKICYPQLVDQCVASSSN